MSYTLTKTQVELLLLIANAGSTLVYGRPASASADSMLRKGLLAVTQMQNVVQMGSVARRPVYKLTGLGMYALRDAGYVQLTRGDSTTWEHWGVTQNETPQGA